MALTQLKTSGIADDAVTTDKLANAINTERTANTAKVSLTDNSVTLAKMAGGTDGQIITYDASGDPVAVGPGTDGQVLTSTGAGSPPAFESISIPAGTTINNNADNRVITGSGTANTLEGESKFTFDGSLVTTEKRMVIGNGTDFQIPSRNSTSSYTPQLQVTGAWNDPTHGATLALNGRNDYPLIWLNSGASYQDNSGAGYIVWSIKDGAGNYCNTASIESQIDGTPGNNDSPGMLRFQTTPDGTCSPTERMRIDSSGNVGIGINNQNNKLEIGTSTHYVVTNSGQARNGIHIRGAGGNAGEYGGGISLGCNNTGAAAIAARQGSSDSDVVGLSFFTHTSGTGSDDAVEKVRIHDSGEVSFNNGICLGNSLTFAAANTMDDYEEGSFTPALGGFSSISYHRQYGYYTKIGRQVWMHIYLYVYQATGDSNKIQITGLPFSASSANSGYIQHGGTLWYQNDTFKSSFNSESKPSIYIDSGDNYARFISQAGSEMNGEDTYLGGGANNRYIICGLQMIV